MRLEHCSRAAPDWLVASLLFESAHVQDQGFGLGVGNAFGRFHQGFAVLVFEAFLGGFHARFILQFGLDLGVGVILGSQFFAHLGFALAIGPVTLGAFLFVQFLAVGGRQG